MEPDSQDEVVAFLGDPNTHHLSSAPEKIETHGAIVFLAGEQVYKIKRNVSYPYMDFSTLEKRKAACIAEIEVNRKNAPNLYVGVIPITRDSGRLQLGGQGHVVEWAVHMRRFDETRTLDRLAINGELTPGIIDQLAGAIADNHRLAPVHLGNDAALEMEKVIDQTLAELGKRSAVLNSSLLPRLSEALRSAHRTNKKTLAARAKAGHVRHCHGDLHLGNIVLIGDSPVLFDAIEFDPSLATIDILYDLSFVVMDLCHRRLQPLACRLLNRYLWHKEKAGQDIEGLSPFPLFLALRACIRANVLATKADLTATRDQALPEIRAYLDDALTFLASARPIVMAIGGLSGSGKSTISDLLAPHFTAAPGAIQLRSDIERKRLLGVGQFTHLDAEAYDATVTQEVYDELRRSEETAIRAGRSAILDATFIREADRNGVEDIARNNHVPFLGFWLSAPSDVLKARLAVRGRDASDATVTVLEKQLRMNIGRLDWQVVDASASAAEVVNQILAHVKIADFQPAADG